MERHEQSVDHVGCRLAYTSTGSGPRVLFIQGVGVHGDGWRPQTDALSARFACLSFDNRGMGKSQPFTPPITVEQMAEDARAVMDAAGWDAAHVVGHSLGGLVAVQLALAARSRVRSLSLLCTFTGSKTAAPMTARMMWLGVRIKVGTRRMRRRAFLGLVLPPGHTADLDATADKLAPLYGHDLADSPPVVDHQLKALRATDLSPRLGELAGLPTLIVNAVHDPIAPPSAGRALNAGIPGSRYVEVADASHGWPVTHAEQANAMLAEHVTAAGAVG
jgi:pimeloyl-ACP methyl ester carboxylesterase